MKRIKVITLAALAILAAACNDNDDIADVENVKPVEIVNGQENGFDYADLGLPSGTLWATCNVGATSPEQAGLYFAWGETVGYTAEQVTSGVRAFNKISYNAGPAASISADLTLEEDAARVHMGGKWRMPTYDEFQELIENTTSTWVSNYMGKGIKGRLFTSKVNRNSIFFPAAGICYGTSISIGGEHGCYCSTSWDSAKSFSFLNFYKDNMFMRNGLRYYGRSVRGVCARK